MPAKQELENPKTTLELDECIAFQKKGWIIQKIVSVVIFLFVIMGALGFFGDGMLSSKSIQAKDVVLEYEKFLRHGGTAQLQFTLLNSTSKSQVKLPVKYLAYFKLEAIVPEPINSRVTNNEIIYDFETAGASKLVFFLSPNRTGNHKGAVKINDNVFQLDHYIYP